MVEKTVCKVCGKEDECAIFPVKVSGFRGLEITLKIPICESCVSKAMKEFSPEK